MLLMIKPVCNNYKHVTVLKKYDFYSHKNLCVFYNTTKQYDDRQYIYNKMYIKYIYSAFSQKFIKIKITSKIYRLYINKRTDLIKSHLNYGHIIRTPILYTIAIKHSKYKLFFYGFNFSYLKNVALKIVYTRPYNIFTARGFRLKPSIVYKKVGKVSAYR